ncbi:O-methyltransferase [Nocardia sp. NPDC051570]|uniref:O-methyltransferase n=1 Tax=Nocardia sp. NPDC051570 TaxID=3364324 RepID=UPI00379E0213
MNDEPSILPPLVVQAQKAAANAGFAMSCTNRTGALLRTLAASKPGGRILELGTGAGVGAAWLLSGMTTNSQLVTIETDRAVADLARGVIGPDPRLTLSITDADSWLDDYTGSGFDMVFVDCRAGKFRRRDDLLEYLLPGGIYIGDDLLPQPTWPVGQQTRVGRFLAEIPTQSGLRVALLNWDSGLVIGTRTGQR